MRRVLLLLALVGLAPAPAIARGVGATVSAGVKPPNSLPSKYASNATGIGAAFPRCAVTDSCFARCIPIAGALTCTRASDGVTASMTNASACGTSNSPFIDSTGTQLVATGAVTDACSPYMTAAAGTTFGINGVINTGLPFTVIVVARSSSDFSATTVQFSHGSSTAGVLMEGSAAQSICLFGGTALVSRAVSISPFKGWTVHAARYDGANGDCWANGTASTTVANPLGDPSILQTNFGSYGAGGPGYATDRGLLAVYVYSAAVSNGFLDRFQATITGAKPPIGPIVKSGRTSSRTITMPDGQKMAFSNGMVARTADGPVSYPAVSNTWPYTTQLDAAHQTVIGATTAISQDTAGPFDTLMGGTGKAYTVTDTDAGAYAGYYGASVTSPTGIWDVTATVKAGTVTAIELGWGAAAAGNCVWSNLNTTQTCVPTAPATCGPKEDETGGWWRISCQSDYTSLGLGGAQPFVVDNGLATTGTYHIAHAGHYQWSNLTALPPFCVNETGATYPCSGDLLTQDMSGWNMQSGEVCTDVVLLPTYLGLTNRELLFGASGTNIWQLDTFGDTNLRFALRGPTGGTSILSVGIGAVEDGLKHHVCAVWHYGNPTGYQALYLDGVFINSLTPPASVFPDSMPTLNIGRYTTDSLTAYGTVQVPTVERW